MGISSVGAMGSAAGGQGTPDSVSRNLKAKISDVEREKQGLTSKQEISAEEKSKKRQELQQDLSSLNAKLKQRQEESRRETIRKEQQGEAMKTDGRTAGMAESGRKPAQADTSGGGRASRNQTDAAQAGAAESMKASRSQADMAKADTAGSGKASRDQADAARADTAGGGRMLQSQADMARADAGESIKAPGNQADAAAAEKNKPQKQKERQTPDQEALRSVLAGDDSREQTRRREAVIARMESGIVILKGEIKQDEIRGADVEKKKAELKEQEQKLQKAVSALPDVKAPFKGAARKKTGKPGESVTGQQQSGMPGNPGQRTVKSSRDGVVIITPNVFEDNNR